MRDVLRAADRGQRAGEQVERHHEARGGQQMIEGDDAKQRETPVHVEQRDQQNQDAQAVADQGNRRAGRGRRHQFDVVGQLREQMPGLLPIEIRRR